MMKSILLSLVFLFASTSFAGSINWEAHGFNADNNIAGMAYLLQYTGDSSNIIADINTHLENNGIAATEAQKANFVLWSSSKESNNGNTNALTITNPNDKSVLANFVVIYIEDNKVTVSKYLSDEMLISKSSSGGDQPVLLTFQDETIEYAEAGATWYNVPEPTALALLALGVAGLALRRKRM